MLVSNRFLRNAFIFTFFSLSYLIEAQQSVVSIYGDLGGFFQSSSSSKNTYDDSNNLLGFTVDGITYSTGVNDPILTSNSVAFTIGNYLAFPMPADINYNSQELIGIATNWGGVSQNNGTGDYIKTFSPIVPSFFVRDGNRGLELSTNFFNIKSQVITYEAIVINQAVSINDAKPDIIVTQTGAPSSATDKFKFIDVNGDTVGSELNVSFNGVSIVSGTDWSIYKVNPSSGLVNSAFGIDTYRDLRVLSFRLSDFGITTTNFSQISNFVHTISGTTDIAFTAYSSDSVEISFPPIELEVVTSTIIADDFCLPTTATFTTKIRNNSTEVAKDFEVDFQIPSTATATSSSASFTQAGVPLSYASYSGLESKWTVIELLPGESVTLTANTSVSTAPFPISFTAVAEPLFQEDSSLSNNTLTISETGNDSDCDGVIDTSDDDDDNDGILDVDEFGGFDPSADHDTDLIPNYKDPDFDTGVVSDTINSFGVWTSLDSDNDGIPNHFDLDSDGDQCPDALEAAGTVVESQLDSDFVITGAVNANGVPILAEAGSGNGQAIGNSQIAGTKSCDTSDTDSDGYIDLVDLDDDNDGILDTDEGTANPDGDLLTNNLDTDSDADGCPDAFEGGANFTLADLDSNNMLKGGVDNNGIPLIATASGQDIGSSQNGSVTPSNCSLPPVIISQVYQTAAGNVIELTNIGASITTSSIILAFFKDVSPGNTIPTATLQIPPLAAGSSVIIKSFSGSLTGTTIINSPLEIEDVNITEIAAGNDTLFLSTTTDNTSWTNRYDVVSNIEDESSFVRIDEVTKANTEFTSSEWINFIDDSIPVLGDTDPIPATTRHANAPLLSEVKSPNAQANNGLGLHRIDPTIRISNAWSNGYPDKSRSVIIQENYENFSNSLKARKIDVQGSNTLSVSNNPLIVFNNTNINTDATIRILGSAQFIQIHEGVSDVSGSGKLLISQKSELPNTYRYNYWSSPVVEFPNGITYRVSNILKDAGGDLTALSMINDIDFISGYDGATGSPIQISNYWIWAFFDNKTRDDWVQLKETSYLDRGLGFTMKSTGENPQYFTFSGSPIDGDITFGITGETTSLVGNPYAGTLDGHAFILNNEDSIDGSLYFWEHSGESVDFGHSKFGYEGGYAQLTFSMGTAANSLVTGIAGLTNGYTYSVPSRYIAAGQGFFVTSDIDGGTIAFSNKQRSYQATEPYFFKESSKNVVSDKLSILKLGIDFSNKNGLTIHRQLGISFNNKHSFEFDYGYESEMIDIQPTDAYWSFDEMDSKKLVIAGVEDIKDNLKVPLAFIIDSNNPVYLRVDEIENIEKTIFLYDAVKNTTKEIFIDSTIKLELSKGVYEDRFFLVFNENTVLSSNNELLERNLDIYMNHEANKIVISNKENLYIEQVEAFNILGKKIKTWNLNKQSKSLELEASNLKTSIYMVKVKSKEMMFMKKILRE
ncbi:DUF11 domain-containing protein [Polaribacter sp. SA4-12]|uniref:DUF11 domain-containing protein n=1 Tax=Polaribacter sp. SA4-12 TaxID=1312072 RepID=UPI000B3C51BF|nr:DUF11 domain-containing protein [Polaribacter sp. SA4-12]ARV16046.1 hypothetical protein BTO07_13210 [Polaribacter sp. SA4-12]